MPACLTCDDDRWVCEEHGAPGDGGDCCGISMPCPSCNVPNEGEFPAMPLGSVLVDDFHGGGIWGTN